MEKVMVRARTTVRVRATVRIRLKVRVRDQAYRNDPNLPMSSRKVHYHIAVLDDGLIVPVRTCVAVEAHNINQVVSRVPLLE